MGDVFPDDHEHTILSHSHINCPAAINTHLNNTSVAETNRIVSSVWVTFATNVQCPAVGRNRAGVCWAWTCNMTVIHCILSHVSHSNASTVFSEAVCYKMCSCVRSGFSSGRRVWRVPSCWGNNCSSSCQQTGILLPYFLQRPGVQVPNQPLVTHHVDLLCYPHGVCYEVHNGGLIQSLDAHFALNAHIFLWATARALPIFDELL